MTIAPSGLLRPRNRGQESRVTSGELFFDLVFIFTVIQISHTLADHYSIRGGAEVLVLTIAVWWVWINTAWATNWLDPDRAPVKLMLFVLMFLGLILSFSIPKAFGYAGMWFAGAWVGMELGRSAFLLFALRPHNRPCYSNFLRVTAWLAVAAVLWLVGAFLEPGPRLAVWGSAVGLATLGPAVGFWLPVLGRARDTDWDVARGHMAERSALFVLICIGEIILASGRSFGAAELTIGQLDAFVVVFISIVAMWWIYFRFGHQQTIRRIETTANPGALARWAFTYAHTPIVVGILLFAVGAQFLLERHEVPVDARDASAILGGPAVFLLGNIWFKRQTLPGLPLSHLTGLALLGACTLVIGAVPTVLFGALVAAILVLVAVWELLALTRTGPPASR